MAIQCGHQCQFRPLCVISGLDEPDVQRKRCPEGEYHRRRYRDAKRSLREDFVHEVYGTHVSVSAGWKGRASRSRGVMLATCPQSTSTMSPTGVISSPRGQQRTFWTALGPPIGGVLFSHEEVRSMFSQEMMILSLCADCYHHAASLMSQAQGSSPCFRCSSTIPRNPIGYVVFVLLGVLGGRLGAISCWGNIEFNRSRHPKDTNSKRLLDHSLHFHPELSHALDANLSSSTIRILCQDWQ